MREHVSDIARASGMCPHGNFPARCPACNAETGTPELGRERLKELNSLNIEVKTDLTPMLDALNGRLGTKMQHRESGFHVTVFGPTEMKALDGLDDAHIERLRAANEAIARGEGLEVRGIGIIDGATADLPKKDKEKKTSFLAVDAPALNEIRAAAGLPPKDFHVTLGFEGGDIHMALVGEKDAKGKDVLRPIEKKADPRFDDLLASMPALVFGGLSGEAKEKKREKAVDPAKEEKERLKNALSEAGLAGKDLVALGFKAGPEMGKIVAAIEKAVKGEDLAVAASEETLVELRGRIERARAILAGQ